MFTKCLYILVSIELQPAEMSTLTSYVPFNSAIQISCIVGRSETIRWTVSTAVSTEFLTLSQITSIHIAQIPLTPLNSTKSQGQLLINTTLELNFTTIRCGARNGDTITSISQATIVVDGNNYYSYW